MLSVVWPGLDLFWECSRKEQDKHDATRIAVRRRDQQNNRWLPEVDLNRVGPWSKTTRFATDHLYELRVTVFDVDRQDWYERLGSAFVTALKVLAKPLTAFAGGALSGFAEEATAGIGRRLAQESDRVLMVDSASFVPAPTTPRGGELDGRLQWPRKNYLPPALLCDTRVTWGTGRDAEAHPEPNHRARRGTASAVR